MGFCFGNFRPDLFAFASNAVTQHRRSTQTLLTLPSLSVHVTQPHSCSHFSLRSIYAIKLRIYHHLILTLPHLPILNPLPNPRPVLMLRGEHISFSLPRQLRTPPLSILRLIAVPPPRLGATCCQGLRRDKRTKRAVWMSIMRERNPRCF